MPLPPTSREAVIQAMAKFDSELRDSDEWRGWERNLNYEHAISQDGRLYPVKQIVSMATGVPKETFSGGSESNSYVTSLGLKVVPVRPEYLLLRSNIGSNWQDSPGERYHFGDTVPNYKRVIPGANVLIDTRLAGGRAIVGKGVIGDVRELSRGEKGREFEATYSLYEPITPPKSITPELDALIRSMPSYNVQHAIRRLTPEAFAKLAGIQRSWVFAGRPDVNDFAELIKLDQLTWSVSSHVDAVNPGDRIYFYRFGPQAGIVAVGQVTAGPQMRSRIPEDFKYLNDPERLGDGVRAVIRVVGAVSPPITRDELERADLGDLAVLRAQGGTNFQVTSQQAAILEKLIASRSLVPPPPAATLGQVVESFVSATKTSGLDYGEQHMQLVVRLLASLMARPFVILTGLSGSGKSQLALKLGQWFGAGRYQAVAVRPDWTGPEAMLGYEDLLQPTTPRPWVVGEVLRLSLKAAADPGRPYLLLLDEMNLAHVERYFADFLSGMESGEEVLPNLIESDGAWRQSGEPAKIPVPANLFVVGTVNVDETTYMFSPKVLDRANTIEFRVMSADLAHAGGKPGFAEEADASLLASFVTTALDPNWHRENRPSWAQQYEATVRTLHETLSAVGWEFGYRTYYDMLRFAAFASAMGVSKWQEVLDLQVLQKVLPRLNGSKRRLEPALSRLGRFCQDLVADDRLQGDPNKVFMPYEQDLQDAKLPMSYDKIRRMHRLLVQNQFASFAE